MPEKRLLSPVDERIALNIFNFIDDPAVLSEMISDNPKVRLSSSEGAYGLRPGAALNAINYRKEVGNFQTFMDIKRSSGIGNDTLADIAFSIRTMSPVSKLEYILNLEQDPSILMESISEDKVEKLLSLRESAGVFMPIEDIVTAEILSEEQVSDTLLSIQPEESLPREDQKGSTAIIKSNLATTLSMYISATPENANLQLTSGDSVLSAASMISRQMDEIAFIELQRKVSAALATGIINHTTSIGEIIYLPQIADYRLSSIPNGFDPTRFPNIPIDFNWFTVEGPTLLKMGDNFSIRILKNGKWINWEDPVHHTLSIEPTIEGVRIRQVFGGPIAMLGDANTVIDESVTAVWIDSDEEILGEHFVAPISLDPSFPEQEELYPPGWLAPQYGGGTISNPAIPPVGQVFVDPDSFKKKKPKQVIVGKGGFGVPPQTPGPGFGGPMVFVPADDKCNVLIKGCISLRKDATRVYTAKGSGDPSKASYTWSVDDPRIASIVGPNNGPTVRIRGKKVGAVTLTVKYGNQGCSTQASYGVSVVLQRFTPATQPKDEKFGLPLLQHAPTTQITRHRLERVDANNQKVDLSQRKVKLNLTINGTYSDALNEPPQKVEVISGSNTAYALPKNAKDFVRPNAFRATEVEVLAPGKTYVRVKSTNTLGRIGTDTLEVNVVLNDFWRERVQSLEKELENLIQSGAAQQSVKRQEELLAKALRFGVEAADIRVNRLTRTRRPDRTPTKRDKWSIAIEDDAKKERAKLETSFESHNVDVKFSPSKKVLLPENKPKEYLLLDSNYSGTKWSYPKQGGLLSTFGDETLLYYKDLNPSCAYRVPVVSVEWKTREGRYLLDPEKPLNIEAVGSPKSLQGAIGNYTFNVLKHPEGAKWSFGSARSNRNKPLVTADGKTTFFTDRSGIYTLQVFYEVGGVSSPWTYDLVDVHIVVKKDTLVKIERLGAYSGDLSKHLDRPLLRERTIEPQPGAEIMIRGSKNASLGRQIQIDMTCPVEIRYLSGLTGRVFFEDGSKEDFPFTIDPKQRFSANLEVNTTQEINRVHLIGIQYGDLVRRQGDAVFSQVVTSSIEPEVSDLLNAPTGATTGIFVASNGNTSFPESPEPIGLVNLILRTRDLGNTGATNGMLQTSATMDNQINLVNGNHYFQSSLFNTLGKGLNVNFSLNYNSWVATRDQAISLYGKINGKDQKKLVEEFGPKPFGDGWCSAHTMVLFQFIDPKGGRENPVLEKCVEVQMMDGNKIVFVETSKKNVYHVRHMAEAIAQFPDTALGLVLTRESNGSWRLLKMNDDYWRFDSDGRVSEAGNRITDKNPKLNTMTWKWSDTSITITDSSARNTTLRLKKGLVDQIQAPDGNKWSLDHTNSSLNSTKNPENHTWSFDYDKFGRMEKLTPPVDFPVEFQHYPNVDPAQLKKDVQAQNFWGRVATETIGNRVRSILYSKRSSNQEVIVIDPEQHRWKYQYETTRQAITTIEYANKNKPDTFIFYQKYGYRDDTKAVDSLKNYQSAITSFTYTDPFRANGRFIKRSFRADNSFVEYIHNDKGLIGETLDELKNKTTYQYYTDGQLKKVIHPEAEIITPKQKTKKELRQEQFRYDNLGRLIAHFGANGVNSVFTFEKNGKEDPSGLPLTAKIGQLTTTYDYDPMGRKVREKNHYKHVVSYQFDKIGRKVKIIEGTGSKKHETVFRYDAQHRVINSIDKADGKERKNTEKFDRYGELLFTQDPLGNKREILKRNKRGEVIQVREPDGGLWDYPEYDALGRLNRTSYPLVAQIGPEGLKTDNLNDQVIEYDDTPKPYRHLPIEKVVKRIIRNGDSSSTTEFWSLRGELVATETTEEGRIQKIVKTYSKRSELLQIDRYEGNKFVETTRKYVYDAYGNQISETVGKLTTRRSTARDKDLGIYQIELLPKQENQKKHPQTLQQKDDNGRLIGTYNGDGVQINQYTYNDDKRTVTVLSQDPNRSGTTGKLVPMREIIHFSNGDVQQEKDIRTGSIDTYERDNLGRITKSKSHTGEVDYEYDLLDRIIKTTSTVEAVDEPGVALVTRSFQTPKRKKKALVLTTEYDEMGRVIERGTPIAREIFQYDQLGRTIRVGRTGMGRKSPIEEQHFYNAKGDLVARYFGKNHLWKVSRDPNGEDLFERDKKRFRHKQSEVYLNGNKRYDRDFLFDQLDNIGRVSYSNGVVLDMEYDQNRRMLSRKVFHGSLKKPISTITWEYGSGNLPEKIGVKAADIDRSIEYDYDQNLRVKEIDDFKLNPNGAYKFEYNAAGFMNELQRPTNKNAVTSWSWHTNGKLKEMDHIFGDGFKDSFTTKIDANQYDAKGNPLKIEHSHTLDIFDKLTGERHSNDNFNQEEKHTYDQRNRLKSSSYKGEIEKYLGFKKQKSDQNREFFYDEYNRKVLEVKKERADVDGNPTNSYFQVIKNIYGGSQVIQESISAFYNDGSNARNVVRKKFEYDELGRKIREYETLWFNGDTSKKWARMLSIEYGLDDKPVNIKTFEKRGKSTYLIEESRMDYDPQGRMLKTRVIPFGQSKIGKDDGIATLSAKYAEPVDFNGNYILFQGFKQTVNHFVHIGQNITALLDSKGKLVEDYLNMPGRNMPVAVRRIVCKKRCSYDYYLNHRGSSMILTDEKGEIKDEYKQVGTYGDRLPEAKAAVHSGMTSGLSEGNVATAAYTNSTRNFSSNESTFEKPDSTGLNGGVNNYHYGNSNPIAFGDDGEHPIVLAIAPAIKYFLLSAGIALLETVIEYGFHSIWGECDFDWAGSYGRNLAIGLASNWIPGSASVRIGGRFAGRLAIKAGAKMGATKLAIKAGRHATTVGATSAVEYAVDKTVFNSGSSLGQIVVGNIGGDLIGAGLKTGWRGIKYGARSLMQPNRYVSRATIGSELMGGNSSIGPFNIRTPEQIEWMMYWGGNIQKHCSECVTNFELFRRNGVDLDHNLTTEQKRSIGREFGTTTTSIETHVERLKSVGADPINFGNRAYQTFDDMIGDMVHHGLPVGARFTMVLRGLREGEGLVPVHVMGGEVVEDGFDGIRLIETQFSSHVFHEDDYFDITVILHNPCPWMRMLYGHLPATNIYSISRVGPINR